MLITALAYQKSIKAASQRSDRTVAYTAQLSREFIETFCISLLLIEVLNIFQTWLVKKRHIFLPWKDLFKGWRMFLHPIFSQHHLLITLKFWSTRTLFFLWSLPSSTGSHLSTARGGTETDNKTIHIHSTSTLYSAFVWLHLHRNLLPNNVYHLLCCAGVKRLCHCINAPAMPPVADAAAIMVPHLF